MKIEIILEDGKYTLHSDACSKFELYDSLVHVTKEFRKVIRGQKSEDITNYWTSSNVDFLLHKSVYGKPIRSYPIGVQLNTVLGDSETRTIQQIVQIPLHKLRLKKGFGPAAENKLKVFLSTLNLRFEMSDEDLKQHYYENFLKSKFDAISVDPEKILKEQLSEERLLVQRFPLSTDVRNLGLSGHVERTLKIAEITTLGELLKCDLSYLSKIRGSGPRVSLEIDAFLSRVNVEEKTD